jgi:FkbM family methyltransferase
MTYIIRLLKKALSLVGLDIVRLSKSPRHTLLGLRQFSIKTVIDVGANRGQFAKAIIKVFPEADLYSFEPVPEAFSELEKWAQKQNKRVAVYNVALGDREDEVTILKHSDHSPSSSILKTTPTCEKYYPFTRKQEMIPVRITTLDGWSGSLKKPLVNDILIKIDVQGYEDRVITGGKRILEMAKVCIAEINLDGLYEDQTNFRDILTNLSDLGYRYAGNLNQTYAGDGHAIFVDAVFVRQR